MVRQLNGCSTSAPRCSVAKQWIERTGSIDEESWVLTLGGVKEVASIAAVHLLKRLIALFLSFIHLYNFTLTP